MKKILLLVLVCAVSSIVIAMEQEQPLNLEFIFQTCPEQIESKLDSKSFVSLSLVSSQFQAVCNAIPVKNQVTYFFADAVEHGNKKMIDRFIAQPDKWMFVHGKEEEVCLENGTDATIKIVKLPLGLELQSFVGDCSLYCVKQANAIVRCFWLSKKINIVKNKSKYICYILNGAECDKAVNLVTKKSINFLFNDMEYINVFSNVIGWFDYIIKIDATRNKSKGGICFWFPLSDPFDSDDIFIKKFAMLMLFVVAAQKNNMVMVNSILDNLIIVDWMVDRECHDLLYETVGEKIYNQFAGRLKLPEDLMAIK